MQLYGNKARWTEYKVDTHERPRRMYEYFVTGRGLFPVDMLRYDSAWPARGEDASLMQIDEYVPQTRKMRSIKMRSYREPTVDRWSSFGWSVGTEDLRSET